MRAAVQRERHLAAVGAAYAGWLTLAALAAGIPPGLEPVACLWIAAIGVLAVAHRVLRPVAVLAGVVAVFFEPALAPWLLAAGFAQLALEAWMTNRIAPPPLDSDLQRALMRARRRDEDVAALVATAQKPPVADVAGVLGLLRVTDSHEIAMTDRRWELRAIFEGTAIDRAAIEKRLAEALPGLRFGWADFPADGATLEVLLDQARADASEHTEIPALSAAQ